MKKLLILGGFPQMIDIVMTAKQMGVYTIVADRDPASPTKRFADRAVDVSTDRIEELVQLCRDEQVDGVFTGFEDFNIHVACKLCRRLGLPFYATEEQLALITDKRRFKDACRAHGVPVVEQYTYENALAEGKYPYIVKPCDSYGSRGITVCHNEEELSRGYARAMDSSASGGVIIERFIESDHGVELFYTVVNGNIHLTATADRYTVKNGETTVPLPVAEVFPSYCTAQMKEGLDGACRRMLESMGLKNGLVLIQALYENGEFFVYEMAYRLTGEQHYRMVERQAGVSLSRFMISLSLGENVDAYDTPLLDDENFIYPSVNYALLLNPGTIQSITGLERVYKIDEVISYNLTHANRDVIKASGDYSHMLRRAIDDVNGYVRVVDENGADMLTARFTLPQKENCR